MNYSVLYHHLILKEDIPGINQDILERLKLAIELRLANSPEQYGKPFKENTGGLLEN